MEIGLGGQSIVAFRACAISFAEQFMERKFLMLMAAAPELIDGGELYRQVVAIERQCPRRRSIRESALTRHCEAENRIVSGLGQPVGRLIRRAKVSVSQGITRLDNAYPGSEFITSTDPLFRPVNMVTAPDGTIYISDMYHGIIQESNWTRKGTYLRKKIEQFGFEKVINHGRIWRLVHDSKKPDFTKPNMLSATPAQLVGYLSHANGWWRDTAQRTLVLRQDASVVPALLELAKTGSSLVGRFHAVWTLEGLGKLDAAVLRELLKDASPQMRVQAIRASESLTKAGDTSFEADVRARVKDGDSNVVIQALLTLNLQRCRTSPSWSKAPRRRRRRRA